MNEPVRAFVFEPFRLDLRTGALYRGEENLNLRPKTFDTLVYLLQHRGRLVSKNELMESIWSEAFVTDDVLVQSVADIRRALGDDARNPVFVQTVPRRGYIFIKPATAVAGAADESPPRADPTPSTEGLAIPAVRRSWTRRSVGLLPIAAALVAALALALNWQTLREPAVPAPSRESIAVLPFEIQADSPGFDWLATGVPDMIGNGIWRSRDPVLGGRRLLEANQAGAGRDGTPVPTAQILETVRKLGATRAVLGKLIKLGSEIQIDVTLVNLATGVEELNLRERVGKSEEIFGAVDSICLKILQNLSYRRGLHGAPGPHLTEITTNSLEAYRHYIAGIEYFLRGGEEGANMAEVELREATRIDPSFGLAHFKLARLREWARAWGYSRADPTEPLRLAVSHSQDMPRMEQLLMSGMAAWLIDQDPERAIEEWGRLENLYPMFAAETGVPIMKVGTMIELGDLKGAIEYGEPYTASPYLTGDDQARLSSSLAKAYRKLGDIPRAVRYSERCVKNWPVRDSQIFRFHLIQLGRNYLDAGRVEEALENFARARDEGAGDASNLTDAGWGFYMAGDKEGARALAQKALQLNPQYGNAYHLLAWIQLADGDYRQAASGFRQAFERTPLQFGSKFEGILDGDLPALYFAGVALSKSREQERAEAAFGKLIDLCRKIRSRDADRPQGSFTVRQSLLLEALATARLGRLEESVELRRSLKESMELYEERLQAARLYAVQNDPENALRWLREAIAAGAREFQHIRDNPDFESLRDLEAFQLLLLAGQPAAQ